MSKINETLEKQKEEFEYKWKDGNFMENGYFNIDLIKSFFSQSQSEIYRVIKDIELRGDEKRGNNCYGNGR